MDYNIRLTVRIGAMSKEALKRIMQLVNDEIQNDRFNDCLVGTSDSYYELEFKGIDKVKEEIAFLKKRLAEVEGIYHYLEKVYG
jgi:hypothetical protein